MLSLHSLNFETRANRHVGQRDIRQLAEEFFGSSFGETWMTAKLLRVQHTQTHNHAVGATTAEDGWPGQADMTGEQLGKISERQMSCPCTHQLTSMGSENISSQIKKRRCVHNDGC